MKKVYLLFGLLLSLLLVNVVYADGPYNFDFETEKEENRAALNAGYKDGYITVDYLRDHPASLVRVYDAKGEILKEKTLNNKIVLYMEIKDNDIYIVYDDYSNNNIKMGLLNDKLSLTETITIEGLLVGKLLNTVSASPIKVTDDEVYLFMSAIDNNYVVGVLPRDLSEIEYKELSSVNKLKKYFPEAEIINIMENVNAPKGYNFRFFGYKNGQVASLVLDQSSCRTQSANQSSKEVQGWGMELPCDKTKVVLIDNDGNIKWEKQIPSKYYSGYEIRFIDEYIAVVLVKEEGTDIVIYDMEGNLVETIKSDKRFTKVIDTDRGFIVAQTECSLIPLPSGAKAAFDPTNNYVRQNDNSPVVVKDNINPCCFHGENATDVPFVKSNKQSGQLLCEENHQVYYLYRNIEPKVTSGKGKIEVIDKQKPGEPVEFVITPDEGYVLGKVKVTDVDGNVVVFTSNRFTMPTADVTIEVEFLVANAETKDIAIIGVSIIAVLAAAIVLTQYKKYKEVK